MRETRSYYSISIIKFNYNHVLISTMRNEFHKTVFNYQNKKYAYFQSHLLLFAI